MDLNESQFRTTVAAQWEHLGLPGVPLLDARIQLHYAAQIVAAPGVTFGEKQADFSHTALQWNPQHRLLMGAEIAEPKGFQVGLGIVDLALVVFDERGRKVDETSLDNMSIDEGLQWLEDVLKNRLGRDGKWKLELPQHELPEHSVGGGGLLRFRPVRAFDEFDKLFGDAFGYLTQFAKRTDDASPAYTWPHHFDTAVLLQITNCDASDEASMNDKSGGENQQTIGVGFSPGDDSYDAPYWYVTPWPYPSPNNLPDTVSPGRWHTTNWVGAVLPVEELTRESTVMAQVRTLDRFIESAVDACRGLLAGQTV